MAINVFVPKFHTDEILNEIRECLDKGWTGMGFKTVEFEEKWKEYTKLPYAHFLNSATSGLHLAIHMLKKKHGWSEQDEIITTPLTFVSTNHAILYERLKPVFCDVDQYLCLDPEDLRKKITSRTRAVVFVGIAGNAGQLNEVVRICRENGIKLILDAAHMAGSQYHGKHVGSEADVSVFSFQAVKNLATADSGMICWMDEEMDNWVRKLSWLGISKDTYARFDTGKMTYKWKYDVPDLGFKYHGNSIIAAIGIVQLKYLDADNKKRNALAAKYDEYLADKEHITRIPIAPGCYSSRHIYQILAENRDDLLELYYKMDIYPGVHYVDNTEYPMYAFAKGTCINSMNYSNRLLSLPLHLNLSEEDIKKVSSIL